MPLKAVKRKVALPVEASAEIPFSIQMTRPAARPRRSLKYNDTFLVLDSHGDIGASIGGSDGLFHTDTRFLSRLELLMDNMQPLFLGSNLSDDNSLLQVDLTNPDIAVNGHIVLPKDTVHIIRSVFVWQKTAYQRIGVRNHGTGPVTLELTLKFDSDFADLFEVRGSTRKRRGVSDSKMLGPDEVLHIYRGLDGGIRQTKLHFHPQPTKLGTHEASYRLEVEAGATCSLFVSVSCDKPEAPKTPFIKALLSARREMRASQLMASSIRTSNEIFNEIIHRTIADLYMLKTETPQGPYPYAGIPWYSTTFGRDGLITALQMLWFDPRIARGVLRRLAAYQATKDDPEADAQPGKILHEMRGGEMAALHEVPFGLYYGSVDSTPLFVLLAGLYVERTGDEETLAELWPAIEAALKWIDGPADADQDGFIEYQRLSDQGLTNQGWKDSFDAIFHADGRLVEGHIALAEVQGYVFAAKRLAACCARRLGLAERAAKLDSDATLLARRFEAAFWCPEIDTYALALDGAKEPCRVRTSNAGQLLFTGIVSAERARKVTNTLMQPPSFSGWGIRTVTKGEARFNPMSYHNGSIWPHDNALIALGFARYGLKQPVMKVFNGLFDAASYMDLRRLPELFCGFQRERQRGPTLYPVACAPQAWASVAPFALLEASLGLEFDSKNMAIRLHDPQLPPFLDHITITDLRLAGSSVDLRIRRHQTEDVSLEITRSRGAIQISVVPST
ncbi:MAG TPA: amylo-alpha-1,6-glucosidase [Pseudolabrys sp.]|nr:amylo-alpha-1,6-glucosidase [Pseudolabrys sp.]